MTFDPRAITAEVFEGGAMHGLAYVPVLQALDQLGTLPTTHVGTSAGALVALTRALRVPPSNLSRLLQETDWSAWGRRSVARLLFRGGLCSLDPARQWIEQRLRDASLPVDLTFADLLDQTRHDLVVVATRFVQLGKRRTALPFHFSPSNTPRAVVAEAVLASMAIPGFYPFVEVTEHGQATYQYCDGGVAANLALDRVAHLPPEQIIAYRVDSSEEIRVADGRVSAEPYSPSLLASVPIMARALRREALARHVPDHLWPRVVRIDTGDISALDFDMDEATMQRLLDCGREGWEAWIRKQGQEAQA